jgi:Alpha/beta hydrolase domain
MRALLVAMHRWVTGGVEPPASQYPQIADNKLVPLSALQFPKIPGVALPIRMHKAYRVDYGPEFLSQGIIAHEPPKVGNAFPMFVPQVNAEDGNETSGIRLPVIQAPLGSYMGWNLRDPKIGAPDELFSMVGSYIQFPRTRAERQKTGDPRKSIEELYQNRDDYLQKITASARRLAKGGYVLERDISKIVEKAAAQWDYTMGSSGRTAAR